MNFDEWEPYYKQIMNDFGFKMEDDVLARDTLIGLLPQKKNLSIESVKKIIEGRTVNIFGASSNLSNEVQQFCAEGDDTEKKDYVTIAADGATTGFIENDVYPDIIVTDLDGYMPDQVEANANGSLIIVHSHGDNIPALKKWVPEFKGKILGTTQVKPIVSKKVYNFGGFTDGDRAVYLAAHFNAKHINLISFEFTKIGKYSYKFDSKIKFRKLTWANLLIGLIDKPYIDFIPTTKHKAKNGEK